MEAILTMGELPPPPQLRDDDPGSFRQGLQWLIDRVYHLDECLDKTQQHLSEASKRMDAITGWQEARDEADVREAAARAERRRWFRYGYIAVDFLDRNGWKLLGLAALIYGVTK